jgi:two-component system sensor histidine kinase KdpD
MLAVALAISTQTGRLRALVADASQREARTRALYRLSRDLAGETRVFDAARTAASLAQEVFGARVVIFLAEEGAISFHRRTSDDLPVPASEQTDAQRAFGGEPRTTRTALYLPLRAARETYGVMAVLAVAFTPEQRQLLEVFAAQIALAIERTLSQRAEADTRVRMQTEQMRSGLLSAVSHDLRTPLAAITGAASTLRANADRLPEETRAELLESIAEEAERLSRLVNNLLDMTRFEAGGVQLQRDLFPLEEIVGAALQRLERQLDGRAVRVQIPDDLPMISGDDVLLGQVIWNLLENAIKYTPEGSPIDIMATRLPGDVPSGAAVQLDIADRGPGIAAGDEDRIFEKFYRGSRTASAPASGAGLGLPICRAIVEAHGGTITVFARDGGGALFRLTLPHTSPVP